MNRSFIMLLVLVIFLGAGFGGSFVGGVIYGQNQAENAADELSPRLGAGGQFPGGGQDGNAAQRGQGRQGQGGGGPVAQGQRGEFAGGQGQGGFAAAQGRGSPGAEGQARGTEGGPGAQATGQGQGNGEDQGMGRSSRDSQADSPAAVQSTAEGDAASSSPAADSPQTGRASERTAPANPNRGGVAGTVQSLDGDVLTVTSPRGDLAVMLSESTRVFQVSETGRESLAAEVSVRVVGSRNPEGGIAAQSVMIVPEEMGNLFGSGGTGGRPRGQRP